MMIERDRGKRHHCSIEDIRDFSRPDEYSGLRALRKCRINHVPLLLWLVVACVAVLCLFALLVVIL
jgi:hypothetical protein